MAPESGPQHGFASDEHGHALVRAFDLNVAASAQKLKEVVSFRVTGDRENEGPKQPVVEDEINGVQQPSLLSPCGRATTRTLR